MAGLDPAIHGPQRRVGARDERGHDAM